VAAILIIFSELHRPLLSARRTSTLLNNALFSVHFRIADHPTLIARASLNP